MRISFSAEDEIFRSKVAAWLEEHLGGEFEQLRYRGGPGDEHSFPEERKAWERKLAEGAVKLEGETVSDPAQLVLPDEGQTLRLSLGKKRHALVILD